jgi:hypothetical protein
MKIMGHKTASMDRRYGIVDVTDIQIARELLANKPQKASERRSQQRSKTERSSAIAATMSLGVASLFLWVRWYLVRVNYLNSGEAREPTPVKCKNRGEAVHLHRGN